MIYLIEDNPDDAEATMRALRKVGWQGDIQHFLSGEAALEQLESLVGSNDRLGELPNLILLDLHMPGMHGHDVLASIKASTALRVIPVVILSSDSQRANVSHSYSLGANSYTAKPISFESLTTLMHRTQTYWFEIAIVPKVLL